ncbi:MAG: 1-acyl-sn-glycerol-3-phosphate acyltransferase [Deltaproteobacteria bacterium]|nr:1-acyl-sn-glycerol-3-phosphate acyltransferase [Deltaproteobacteria bacterium]
MIRGILTSVAILMHTLVGSLLIYICGAVARSERGCSRLMDWWGRWFVRLGGWSVHAEGIDLLPEGGAILVSNHQSLVDIPLLITALNRGVGFLSKRELGRIPLFGKAMAYGGNLFIDRDDPRDALHLMRDAVRRIREGKPVVIFPEGTRSEDGTIGEFKPGAFYLAQKAGVPVVPVFIDGGRRALPKGSLLFRPAGLVVRVLPPLPPEAGSTFSRQEIAFEARRRILAAAAVEERGAAL